MSLPPLSSTLGEHFLLVASLFKSSVAASTSSIQKTEKPSATETQQKPLKVVKPPAPQLGVQKPEKSKKPPPQEQKQSPSAVRRDTLVSSVTEVLDRVVASNTAAPFTNSSTFPTVHPFWTEHEVFFGFLVSTYHSFQSELKNSPHFPVATAGPEFKTGWHLITSTSVQRFVDRKWVVFFLIPPPSLDSVPFLDTSTRFFRLD